MAELKYTLVGADSDFVEYVIYSGEGGTLASVYGHSATEAEQRARLFAAAPDTLNALWEGEQAARRVVEAWQGGDLAQAVRDLFDWAEGNALPAIKSAEALANDL